MLDSEERGGADWMDAGEPEPGQEDLVLSVPLDGNMDAEGFAQPVSARNLEVEDDGSVQFGADSFLSFPDAGNIDPEKATISLDVEPTWNGADGGDNVFLQVRSPGTWDNRMAIFRAGDSLQLEWLDESGQDYRVKANIEDWVSGENHTVTATWGDNVMSIYIDGQIAAQETYEGRPGFTADTPLFLGSNPLDQVPGPGGALRNFKVYSRSLSPEEVWDGFEQSHEADSP